MNELCSTNLALQTVIHTEFNKRQCLEPYVSKHFFWTGFAAI